MKKLATSFHGLQGPKRLQQIRFIQNGLRSGAGVAVDISGGNFQSAAFFADQFDCGRSHGLIDWSTNRVMWYLEWAAESPAAVKSSWLQRKAALILEKIAHVTKQIDRRKLVRIGALCGQVRP